MTTPEELPGNTTTAAADAPPAAASKPAAVGGPSGATTSPAAAAGTPGRKARTPAARTRANRGRSASAPAPPPGPAPRHDVKLTDAAARAVQTGYNVIAENIEQGRMAAARFREGKYNIRDVPKDAQEVGERMLKAARELSTTAIEAGEWLLKLASSSGGARDGRDGLKLTVRVATPGAAVKVHTVVLSRPKTPGTAPQHLSVVSLAPHPQNQGAVAIPQQNIRFRPDITVEGGVVAEVTVPAGQKPGVYSGQVYATRAGEEAPLGLLSVEVPAAPPPKAKTT